MIDPGSWNSRVISIEFAGEPSHKDPSKYMVRSFKNIRQDITDDQVLQFSKAVAKLTPGGDDATVVADVEDHYMIADYDPAA